VGKNKKIIIAENELHMPFFKGENIFVSVNPNSIKKFLQEDNNFDFKSTNCFFGKKGHEFVSKESNNVIRRLEQYWEYSDSIGLKDTYKDYLMFYLRFILNRYLTKLFIISQVEGKYKKNHFLVQEGDLFDLTKKYFSSNKIESILEKIKQEKSADRNFNLPFLLAILSKLNIVAFKAYFFFFKRKKFILAADDSYDSIKLIKPYKRKIVTVYLNINLKKNILIHFKNFFMGRVFPVFLFSKNKTPSREITKSIDNFLMALEKENCFTFLRTNICSLVIKDLKEKVIPDLIKLEKDAFLIHKLANYFDIAFATHSVGRSNLLGEIFSISNKPSYLFSHGTLSNNIKDPIGYQEWLAQSKTIFMGSYKYTAVKTPMSQLFYDSIKAKKPIAIKTSLQKEKLHMSPNLKEEILGKRFKNNLKIITHAGTPKCFNNFRPWIYETIDEYISNINDLIRTVDESKDYFLILRYREANGLNPSDLKKMLINSDNFVIHTENTIEEIIEVSDVLVSYSSTTIEQFLEGRKPVILYDPQGKYFHFMANLYSNSPVSNCCSRGELKSQLDYIFLNYKKILSSGEWKRYSFPENSPSRWFKELDEY